MILPRPTEAFDWTEADGRPALVCRPLDRLAAHVFTTRHWRLGATSSGADRTPGWDEVASAVAPPPASLVHVHQVHGTSVVVGRVDARTEADILLAGDADVAVAVQVADCVPLLMADARTGAVAAVHAGWRGLAARAPGVAVAALAREFGSRPSDLTAAIGPSIGQCCYQVGPDVRDRFVDAGFGTEAAAWFSPTPAVIADNLPMPGLRSAPRPDRWFFDSWASARAQLIAAGLPPDQVFSAGLCTASHPDVLCSYRRDGLPAAGRIAGAIRRRPRRPSPHLPAGPRGRSTRV